MPCGKNWFGPNPSETKVILYILINSIGLEIGYKLKSMFLYIFGGNTLPLFLIFLISIYCSVIGTWEEIIFLFKTKRKSPNPQCLISQEEGKTG